MHRNPARAAIAGVLLCAMASELTAQTPIDFRTWTVENYGPTNNPDWVVSANGDTVTQTINGWVGYFIAPERLASAVIEGGVAILAGDDDFNGFVIGFQPGDTTNHAANFLLIDWKATGQNYDGGACTPAVHAPRGLALSRVYGVPTDDELWGHVNFDAPCSGLADGVTEIARGATLGGAWRGPYRPFMFRFEYSPTHLRVLVNGIVEFDLDIDVPIGHFGFYNFSQPAVEHSLFTYQCNAFAHSFGAGHPGTLGVPALTTSAAPVLGTSINLLVANAAGSPTVGALFFGFEPANIPSGLGGNLLTFPLLSISLSIPTLGATVPFVVPNDPFFCGGLLYLQALHLDAGASQGIAFTPGLELVGGT